MLNLNFHIEINSKELLNFFSTNIRGLRFGEILDIGFNGIKKLTDDERVAFYNVNGEMSCLPKYLPNIFVSTTLINQNKEIKKLRKISLYYVTEKKFQFLNSLDYAIRELRDVELPAESETKLFLQADFVSHLGAILFSALGEIENMEEMEIFKKFVDKLPKTLELKIIIEDYQSKIISLNSIRLPLRE